MTYRYGSFQTVVFACVFAVIFALFIDAKIGGVLLYAIILMSLASYIFLRFSYNHFTVSLKGGSGLVECGKTVEYEVVLEKKGFCFIPFIELSVNSGETVRICTSLLFRKSVVLKGTFVAQHSGLCDVVIEDIFAWDFIRYKYFTIESDKISQIAVYPKMIDYTGPEVMPNMLPFEGEEVEEGRTVLCGGVPGYDHREYAYGDSLRRINYKLSAKRGKLMVRMDESSGYASTNLKIAQNAMPICCDKAFALARLIVSKGGTIKITHCGEAFTAATPETLERMREWLAFRRYSEEVLSETAEMDNETNVLFYGNGEIIVQN